MRWLTCSTLLSMAAMSMLSTAQAQCQSSSGTSATGSPSSQALTMFVTSGDFVGDFTQTEAAATGFLAGDNICTVYAASSSLLYDQNALGQTVQFTALVSGTGIDAVSRITPGIDIQNTQGHCLASNINDLFQASNNAGYTLNGLLFDESGDVIGGSDVFVFTGTGTYDGTPGDASNTANAYGGKYHAQSGGTFSAAVASCSDWTNTGSSCAVGVINVGGGGNANAWIYNSSPAVTTCNIGYRLYCVSSQAFSGTQPGGNGDPQFTGLQGQSFQVHGMPDEFFNLITTPSFQLNSRFAYLASGHCNFNNTECWTHPGTYVDQLGFMFPGLHIKAVADSHAKGLRVWVNDEEMHTSKGRLVLSTSAGSNSTVEVVVSHPHHDQLTISCPLFTVEVTNSDFFFNFNVMFHSREVLASGRSMYYLHDSRASMASVPAYNVVGAMGTADVYPAYPMHGLVGQTWKNARYAAKRMYQGEVDDYMMLDHTLFSKQFMFNLYTY